jgi:ABC-2 type transport system permease protein
MSLRHTISALPALIGMYVKTKAEYRGAFWLDRFAQIVSYGCAFGAIWLLLQRFPNLGGWVWPELALLLSFQLLCYALGASLSFVQLRDLEELVRLGTFDTLMVKPISPWAYLVFSGLEVGYVGHIVLAIGLIAWALTQVQVDWSLAMIAYLVASTVSAAMLTAALITMIGTSALIWVRSTHLFSIFFGFWELTRYPLNIFPLPLQVILLTVVPMAFMSYVPIAFFLGKDIPIFGAAGGLAAPFVGPCAVLVAMAFWRFAIGRYQGAGG